MYITVESYKWKCKRKTQNALKQSHVSSTTIPLPIPYNPFPTSLIRSPHPENPDPSSPNPRSHASGRFTNRSNFQKSKSASLQWELDLIVRISNSWRYSAYIYIYSWSIIYRLEGGFHGGFWNQIESIRIENSYIQANAHAYNKLFKLTPINVV